MRLLAILVAEEKLRVLSLSIAKSLGAGPVHMYSSMSFFSEAEHKFDVIVEGQSIKTESFLKACSEILPFLGQFAGADYLPSPTYLHIPYSL